LQMIVCFILTCRLSTAACEPKHLNSRLYGGDSSPKARTSRFSIRNAFQTVAFRKQMYELMLQRVNAFIVCCIFSFRCMGQLKFSRFRRGGPSAFFPVRGASRRIHCAYAAGKPSAATLLPCSCAASVSSFLFPLRPTEQLPDWEQRPEQRACVWDSMCSCRPCLSCSERQSERQTRWTPSRNPSRRSESARGTDVKAKSTFACCLT
jgi:hypothetical protein